MGKYLVTGGAGFIGSNIVEALVARGDQVRVLDNLSMGHLHNLSGVADQIELIQGDICEPDDVASAVEDIEYIFHQAALASVPLSVEAPLKTHAACVTGTVNILDAARNAGVKRLVYAASSSCYGEQPTASKRESDPLSPLSPYAAAKLSAELYCRAFAHTYPLECVCLRYFNVFGPRQDPDSPYSAVIPLFITAMLKGESPTVYGDGKQSRDFTFVENVVQANLLAAEVPGVSGQVFNVADGRSISLLQLIDNLNQLLDLDIQPKFEPARTGDIRESMADITATRSELGYEPGVDFLEGLTRSITYYRSLVST